MEKLGFFFGTDEVKQFHCLKAAVAEVLGTSTLLMIGCGAVATLNPPDGAPLMAIAFAFGLALTLAIWTFGDISGAHVNPVVTVSFLVTGNMGISKCLIYIMCQLLGGVLGSGFIWLTFPRRGGAAWGFLVESVTTFLLVLTVYASSNRLRTNHSGLIAISIGFCVTANVAWSGNLTGGSMNPARSFGPALWSGIWKDHWLYWTAPFVGGLAAALLYQKFFSEKVQNAEDKKSTPSSNLRRGSGKRRGFLDYTIYIEGPKERVMEGGVIPSLAQAGFVTSPAEVEIVQRSFPICSTDSQLSFLSRADGGQESTDVFRLRDVWLHWGTLIYPLDRRIGHSGKEVFTSTTRTMTLWGATVFWISAIIISLVAMAITTTTTSSMATSAIAASSSDSGTRSAHVSRQRFNGRVVKWVNRTARSVIECSTGYWELRATYNAFWFDEKQRLSVYAKTNPGLGPSLISAPEYVYS
ncbi:Aquaporin-4 [Bulinus truncatus]|nr:Aquaporin-4 [Bulinus truncatus]